MIGSGMFGLLGRFPFRFGAQASADQREVAATELAEKDAALAALFETGTAGIAEVDMQSGRFVRVNQRFCEFVKRDAALLLTLRPSDITHPDDREAVVADARKAMEGVGRWEAEVRHILPNGETVWARLGSSIWKRDESGAPLRRITIVQDITESVRSKERQRQSEELLRLGQQVGRIGTFTHDIETGLVRCGADARRMFGQPPGDEPIEFEAWTAAFHPEDQPRILEAIKVTLQRGDAELACELRIIGPDGCLRHLELRVGYFYDEAGRPTRTVGAAIDVTERKQAEERLTHAARHDTLTGLPNRALFRERLNQATSRAQYGQGFAVLCLDLDRFKDVNDTFGHPQGDRLLIEVAARLREELRPDDTLARLGGDEFAVIHASSGDPEEVGRLARRLVDRLGEPFVLSGQRVLIGASVGVAVAPRDGAQGEELLSAADLALYQAKAQTMRGWRFFEPQMNVAAQSRRDLERDLRAAVEREEFELFYQPVLEVSSLRIKHFEALIRWRHPQRGLVAPDSFIPLCEQAGLILPLGAWVLRRACEEAASWPAEIGVAVNISAVQVAAGNLDFIVAAALAESGLKSERLELEITETSLLNNSESTLATLHKIKALGVRIAMDDFGAGHSSLGYLQRFPFDKVKIDRAFARDVDCSPKSAAIVKAMLDLCAALGLTTTIEGVETEAQFRALAKMGGTKVQGYLFSRPQPAHCVPALLAQFGGAPQLTVAAA